MPPAPCLRPEVLAAREVLAAGHQRLQQAHAGGAPALAVCRGLSDLVDGVILERFEAIRRELGERWDHRVTLVAHSGYGRRELAAHSDIDLMLLVDPAAETAVAPLARILTQQLYDSGLQLGFSLRTPAQACALAHQDISVFTALTEARLVAGSVRLYARFFERFSRDTQRRSRVLVAAIDKARREERRKYGETVFLLEPNVKRSRGGLRDLHLIRWLGFVRFGDPRLEKLAAQGALTPEDWSRVSAARDFLLRLRHELHFHAGRGQDLLAKDEQLRLARQFGYTGEEGVLPVEQFMRDYFEYTSEVRYVSALFFDAVRTRFTLPGIVRPIFGRQLEGDFWIEPTHITTTERGRGKLDHDLACILRLLSLANSYGKRIDHATWMTIRHAMLRQPNMELTPEAARQFLTLLAEPRGLANILRHAHQLRVLEKIVPGMRHARCLLQFNEYHKYTVDEHSLRAVEQATQFAALRSPLGEAYRSLRQKDLLHLALLVHDLGKGFSEDHSEVGRILARETARRLELPAREADTLELLVHKHLLMSHLALRQDLNDEGTAVRLAIEVGSPDVLQMLYVLTCADLAAVGPGVLNDWKLELITQLYLTTRRHLADDAGSLSQAAFLSARREAVRLRLKDAAALPWWQRQIAGLPASYLLADAPERIVMELERLRQLALDEVVAWDRYVPERKAIALTVGAHEEITPGVFHRLTGALTSKGLQILSAEIHTLADNLILDRFYVQDTDFPDQPPPERLAEVRAALVSALRAPREASPSFRRLWHPTSRSAGWSVLPTRVQFDNSTSDRCSIITIFAYDRMGLLYAISRTLYELGLSVQVAKIATYLDQVVDVFYVVDAQGQKVLDEQRLATFRERLLSAIEPPA